MHRYPGIRPRNVTVTEDERVSLLRAAPPHLRLWLLLCSDLAMRSGTAARIGPADYNAAQGTLRFATKYGAKLTLPATAEVAQLLDLCDLRNPQSFVRQLWPLNRRPDRRGRPPSPGCNATCTLNLQFRNLCQSLGIARYIRPHDLRRTAAVAMLRHTNDLQAVRALLGHRSLSSTIWYLDHDLQPIERQTLEAIKRPFLVKKEQTA